MPKKILIFVAIGLAWVFLLSIPVGQGKLFFDIAHHYLVDSKPVHWVFGQFYRTVAETKSASESISKGFDSASDQSKTWYQNSRDSLSQKDLGSEEKPLESLGF